MSRDGPHGQGVRPAPGVLSPRERPRADRRTPPPDLRRRLAALGFVERAERELEQELLDILGGSGAGAYERALVRVRALGYLRDALATDLARLRAEVDGYDGPARAEARDVLRMMGEADDALEALCRGGAAALEELRAAEQVRRTDPVHRAALRPRGRNLSVIL